MKLFHYIFMAGVFMSVSGVYAQKTPITPYDEGEKYRILNNRGENGEGVDFSSIAVWNEYQGNYTENGEQKNGWLSMPTEGVKAPWEYDYFNDPETSRMVTLKMDGSTANITSDFIHSNVTISGLYNSTLNIKANVDIGGGLGTDGGMQIFISGGVKFKAGKGISVDKVFNNQIRSLISVVGVDNEHRSAIETAGELKSGNGGDFIVTYADVTAQKFQIDGGGTATFSNATITLTNTNLNDAFLRAGGNSTSSGVVNITDSIVNGRAYVDAYGKMTITNSTVTAAGGYLDVNKAASYTLDNSNAKYSNGGISINISTDTADPSDLVSSLTIKGGSTLWVSGNLRIGTNNSVSGLGLLSIEGDNNTLSVNGFEFPNVGRSGGDSLLHVNGKNNLVEVRDGNINIDGYISTAGSVISGGTRGVLIEGEGNTFTSAKRISLGRNDSGANGTFLDGGAYFKISSTNRSNKAGLYVNQINLGLAYVDGAPNTSKYTTELEIGGNTIVAKDANTNEYTEINLGSSSNLAANGGFAKMTVKGNDNMLYLSRLKVASFDNLAGGEAIMDVTGSRHRIYVRHDDGLKILDGNGISGGLASVTWGGSNNRIEVNSLNQKNGIRIANGATSGGTGELILEGSNNSLNIVGNNNAGLFIKSGGNSSGGTGIFILRGTNNTVTISDEVKLGNSNNSTGGEGIIRIGGTGNTISMGMLTLGTGSSTNTYGRFIVDGGGNTIKINGGLQSWINTADRSGAYFEFNVNDLGISAVDFGGIGATVNAYILIDFTNLTRVFDGEYLDFLVSTNGTLTMTRSNVKVTLSDGTEIALEDGVDTYGNEDEGFTIVQDGDSFSFVYHNYLVPEPSAYAAIFGALALTYAVYRRRRV